MLDESCLDKLDVVPKETKWFSNPQDLRISLTALRMLQPQAFGLLHHFVILVLYFLIVGLYSFAKIQINNNVPRA